MKNLKVLRKKEGLTLKEIANKFGVSFQLISKYERGDCQPDPETLIKFADYFGVSVDYLIGRTGASSAPFGTSASPLNEEEYELLKNFRLLNESSRNNISSLAAALAGTEGAAYNRKV